MPEDIGHDLYHTKNIGNISSVKKIYGANMQIKFMTIRSKIKGYEYR
jgi:hypothetical protein